MDKVIDGVDVSGCEFSCENPLHEIKHSCNVRGYEKDNGLHIHFKCKDNPNCYYKQLKRLEQENEELKQENEQLKKSIDRIMQNKEIKTIDSEIALLNAELQQENKRLIARLRPLEDSYFKGLSSIEIAGLAKKSIRITAENRKLEDALQEIREIVSEPCIVDENCQTCNLGCMQKDILTKINEVIGAE